LVRHAALKVISEKNFAHALFADLHGYDEAAAERVQPTELYAPLLQGLGIPGQQIPESAGERATLYHRILEEKAAAGQSALIWLDNIGDRGQIEELIPTGQLHRLVVTTRETFPRDKNRLAVELDLLPIDDAVGLLTQAVQIDEDVRVESDPDASRRLAQLCDRLPLALQIIAALVVDEPSRPVSEFESELREEEHRLDNLQYDDRLSVRAALTLSYKRLPDELQRLFRLLSQVPGGDISLDAARWLIDAPAPAVRPQLMALVRSHLLQQHVANRWSMHDLVRIYSAEMALADPADADRALKSVVGKYGALVVMAFEWLTAVASEATKKVFPTPDKAARWFEAELATAMSIVTSIADREDYEQICLQFGVALGDLLKPQAHWRNEFHDVAAITASVAARVSPQLVAASALSNYGTSLRLQRKYQQSQDALEQAIAVYEEIGDLDRASGARSNIGNLFQEQGRLEDAIAIYRQDLEQCPPSIHPHAAANTLTNLGAALSRADRPSEAVTELSKAVSLCRSLDDRSGLATALRNLGASYIALSTKHNDTNCARKAVAALTEAREISHSLLDAKGQADAANNLGVALCLPRDFKQGVACLSEALEY
jgi:tetratricopeptide (TPR) repeat protein